MSITPQPAGSLLVGRVAERAWLDGLLGRAEAGEPLVAVVSGEAGVGKTTLVERFAADAAVGGARVVIGACIPLGQEGLPLAPITAVLRDLVEQIGAERLLELLPGVASGLLPELGDPTTRVEPPSQGQLFQLLVVLLEQLSREQPIVVIIEDLHWAGRSTCELLGVWARGLRHARVLVVATCRTDELHRDDPLRSFLAELERLRGVHRIQLEPLSRTEIAELLEAALGRHLEAAERDRIYQRSGGNPLFAEELGQVGTDGGDEVPRVLRELLLARLARLPTAARQPIAAAAVGGDPVGHQLLGSAAGIPEADLLEGLRAAVDGQVLTAVGGGYAFRHALIREVVYADLLPGERIRLHRGFAEALQARPELVGPERLASAQAHHWRLAQEPAKALPALLRAAGDAAAVAAWAEQHQLLTRALRLWPEVDDPDPGQDHLQILESAITAAHRAGEHQQALVLLEQALSEADHSREPERVATLLARRSELLLNLSREGDLDAAQDAVRVAPAGSAAHAQGLGVLAAALGARGRLPEAVDAARRAVEVAAGLGTPELLVPARTSYGLKLSRLDRHDEALAELRAAKGLAERASDPRGLVRVQFNLAFLLWENGRYAEAADIARHGVEVAEAAGLARTLGTHAAGIGAAALVAMGRWEDADVLLAQAMDTDPTEVFAIYPRLLAAELAAARGDLDTATRQLTHAQRLTDQYGVTQGVLIATRVAAEVALQEGRIADARHAFRDVLESTARTDRTTLWWLLLNTAVRVEAHMRTYARAFHSEADADDDTLEALCAVAGRLSTATPAWRANAAQFAAEVHSLDGPREPREWLGVVEAWDRLAAPHPAAYARLRAAEAVLAAGDRAGGEGLLRLACEAAGQLGARPLLRETELLARRAGVTLTDTRDEATPVSQAIDRLRLTPRETEVLRLVAGGLTNRKIATELYITEKTASVHVSRILAKLGAVNRGEAAAVAHKLRLFDDPGSA